MSKKIKILYVDDEANNLSSFRSFFRKEYDVYTAESAFEAFNIMKGVDMQILVTDQRMPQMTGVEFLEQTILTHPDSIRLLITGYSDIKTVIEAVNKGQINKYIEKPWDWDKLKLVLENCVDLYNGKRALKIKNLELQKTNDELNRFIYSASHDLRSPLMSILGIVQLAKLEENLTLEYLNIIETNILKLDEFIKNIIKYYQNSRSDELLEKIDFKQMLSAEIDMLRNIDSSVTFETDIVETGDFVGDYFRIRLVLNNLISNAIKYRDSGKTNHIVNIQINTNQKEANIKVIDNGVGMAEEHLGNIFKMFYRAQSTSSKQGSGIGLFIVKESLEKIGGSITVNSTQGKGTEFEVLIPNKTA